VTRGRLLIVAAVAAATALTVGPPVASRSSARGVYTGAQADQGATIYAARCAMCHGRQLEGTVEIPALSGKFVANWASRPVGDLFDYIARAMPQPAPGSLSSDDNARLVAFLLRANGAPAGNQALPADRQALRRIDFDTVPPL